MEQCCVGIRYNAWPFPSGSCHQQGLLEMGHSHHGGAESPRKSELLEYLEPGQLWRWPVREEVWA